MVIKEVKITIEKIWKHIQDCTVPPDTDNLEEQKHELRELSSAVSEILKINNPHHKMVLTLDYQKGQEWFVIGDLHSDYCALSRILMKVFLRPGLDPDCVHFIFLGDYVDRGKRPIQVLRLLLRLKKEWPAHFFLLRGNHELWRKNDSGSVVSEVTPSETIGFWQQHFGGDLFQRLADLFDLLPLAFRQQVRVDQNVLYVHGGIPRKTHLNVALNEYEDVYESLQGFLWSDPEDKDDVAGTPSRRFSFGTKDFETFFETNHIDVMVRGHEAKQKGVDLHKFFMDEDGRRQRLITVFSSGGRGNDDSGYCNIIPDPRFLQLCTERSVQDGLFSIEEVFRDDLIIHIHGGRSWQEMIKKSLISQALINHNDLVRVRLVFDGGDDVAKSFDESDEYDAHSLSPQVLFGLSMEERSKFSRLLGYRFPLPKNQKSIRKSIEFPRGEIGQSFLDSLIKPIIEQVIKQAREFYPTFGCLPEDVIVSKYEMD